MKVHLNQLCRTALTAVVLTSTVFNLVACGDATAMGKKPTEEAPVVVAPAQPTQPVVTETASVIKPAAPATNSAMAGTFKQGYTLGERNGDILVQRLRARTVEISGCAAVDELEAALLNVSAKIKPPVAAGAAPDAKFIKGFYKGYIDALKAGIQEVRAQCHASVFESGEFTGNLFGALLCQISTISIDIVTSVEATPFYDGWTGGELARQDECRIAAEVTLESCSNQVNLVQLLELTVKASCTDQI